MSKIIAGRFETQPQVEQAIAELQRAGLPLDQVASFYVNPPGQHDAFPIGGDTAISPGAEDTPKGAAAGVVAGAAAGLAAAPVIGPVGPLVGAYVGSMIGGLAQTKEGDETESPDRPHEHRAGLYVAVAAEDDELRGRMIDALDRLGAMDIEIAEGTIENGDWVDFNPVTPPHLIKNPPPEPRVV
jgi:hypothetical protein